jgi:uncharacterized protein (TIGR02118 family)
MVKLIALYKKPADVKAFEEHYFGTHLPLADKIPGLKKVELSRVTGSPMGDSDYHLMAELYFENMDALKAGMSSPEGKASGKDVMSFAKDIVYMMFAEVEEKVPATAGK